MAVEQTEGNWTWGLLVGQTDTSLWIVNMQELGGSVIKSIPQARLTSWSPQASDDYVPLRLPACGVIAPTAPGPGFFLII